jgi:hypothetical protein
VDRDDGSEVMVTGYMNQWGSGSRYWLLVLAAFTSLSTAAEAKIVLLSTMDDADVVGTSVLDKTAPAENGALQLDVFTGAAGQIGQALDAHTIGGAAAVSYGDVLDPGSSDMTAMVWFNANSVLSQFLVRKGNAASPNEGWSISLESRNGGEFLRVFGRVNATGGSTNEDRALLLKDFTSENSTSTWHHAALVIHGAGSIEFFVDGSNADVTTNVWGDTFTTEPTLRFMIRHFRLPK